MPAPRCSAYFWIVMAVVAGIVASNKGRCGVCWALSSLVLSPLLILVLLALRPLKAPTATIDDAMLTASERGETAETKTCPQCAEIVKTAAKICRFCRHEFPAATVEPIDAASAARGYALLEVLDPFG